MVDNTSKVIDALNHANAKLILAELKESYNLDGCCKWQSDDPYVFLDKKLRGNKFNSVLAHEIGHVMRGYTTCSDYDEYRADKYATLLLISIDDLIEALKKGIDNVPELSNYFQVTPENMCKYIDILKKSYGECFEWGNYEVSLNPIFVRDSLSGIFYPTVNEVC